MKRSHFIKIVCSIFFMNVLAIGTAYAGGVAVYEFGTPDVGLAAAGYAARAQDASTVFTNPAGMCLLDSSQAMAGLQGIYADLQFNPSNTTWSGGGGGKPAGWAPGGSLFLVQKVGQDLRFGFGVLSYFGAGLNYDDGWAGRYYAQKEVLIGLTLTPAVSYRVNQYLSIGAGLNAMYGYLDYKGAVNNLGAQPDGEMKYKDETWGFGANAGVLVELSKHTRLGLDYLSEVKLDFSAAPEFSGLGLIGTALQNRGLLTNALDMKMTVPQMVMFSAYQELNDNHLAIMGNIGWQNWSQFGKVDVSINSNNPQSLTTDLQYKDTWHVALGAQYKPFTPWIFSCGVAYDSSAVNDDNRTVTLPMGEQWRFALGTQYLVNQSMTLGFAYEFIWIGDMSVNQNRGPLAGQVAGNFDDAQMHVLALNITWKY